MKTLWILLFVSIAIVTFNSCEQKGCTDSTALNYDSAATQDDGSCIADPRIPYYGSYQCIDSTFVNSTAYDQTASFAVEIEKDGSDNSKIVITNFESNSGNNSAVVTSNGDFSFSYYDNGATWTVTGSFSTDKLGMTYIENAGASTKQHRIHGAK